MKAILHTKGLVEKFDPNPQEREIWGKVFDMMDSEEAEVYPSGAMEGKYVFLGLNDEEKNKELAYQMEQDPMTGVYIDDRERFDRDWDNNEYEPDVSFYLEAKNVEIIPEDLAESNDCMCGICDKCINCPVDGNWEHCEINQELVNSEEVLR